MPTDRMTPEQRRRCMQSIKGKNTTPEMLVRRYLHAEGFRYSLHNKRLPGKPDLVLRRFRTVILVNGCFWHGHENCQYFRLPSTRAEFWRHKIELNKARDLREQVELRNMGWHVIIVWECQLKPANRASTLKELKDRIRQLYLEDHRTTRLYTREDSSLSTKLVAEDEEASYNT